MYPGGVCGIPVGGIGLLGLGFAFTVHRGRLPDALVFALLLISAVGAVLCFWCPRRLLPGWLKHLTS